jgi:hypothetical protein
MIIKKGSYWSAAENKKFVVIDEIVIEGIAWVHYRDALGDPPKEYSCYRESFLSRFRALPE